MPELIIIDPQQLHYENELLKLKEADGSINHRLFVPFNK